jgi:hypothetical protein
MRSAEEDLRLEGERERSDPELPICGVRRPPSDEERAELGPRRLPGVCGAVLSRPVFSRPVLGVRPVEIRRVSEPPPTAVRRLDPDDPTDSSACERPYRSRIA